MASMNLRLFLLSLIVLPFSLWSLRHYQSRLVGRVKAVRERGADIGSFLIETLLGIRVVVAAGARFVKWNVSATATRAFSMPCSACR